MSTITTDYIPSTEGLVSFCNSPSTFSYIDREGKLSYICNEHISILINTVNRLGFNLKLVPVEDNLIEGCRQYVRR